jgi:hypothetical protein
MTSPWNHSTLIRDTQECSTPTKPIHPHRRHCTHRNTQDIVSLFILFSLSLSLSLSSQENKKRKRKKCVWLTFGVGLFIKVDDPYLGPSAAQQPYPGTLSNLGYDEQPGYSPQQSQQQQRGHDLQSQPSLTSSVGQDSSSLTSPTNSRHQQQHLHHNMSFSDTHQQQQQQQQQQQYPIAWDGPEDIPLTVVNNSQHPQGPPTPLHNPYQKP